jgi:hypothetical protein
MTQLEWFPAAVKREMPFSASMPDRDLSRPTVIAHTNGGGANLYPWFSRPGNDICSHFQIFWDGTCEQYLPRSKVAYAEYAGNAFAIAVEMQDDGDNTRPYTAAQLSRLRDIIEWEGAPIILAPENGPGIGYHSQYSSWNQSLHDCPGPVRQKQLLNSIPQWSLPITGGNQMLVLTRLDGSSPRLVDQNSFVIHGIMGPGDINALKSAPPAVVTHWAVPDDVYNGLVKQHATA